MLAALSEEHRLDLSRIYAVSSVSAYGTKLAIWTGHGFVPIWTSLQLDRTHGSTVRFWAYARV
jgi:hypothetical protein